MTADKNFEKKRECEKSEEMAKKHKELSESIGSEQNVYLSTVC